MNNYAMGKPQQNFRQANQIIYIYIYIYIERERERHTHTHNFVWNKTFGGEEDYVLPVIQIRILCGNTLFIIILL